MQFPDAAKVLDFYYSLHTIEQVTMPALIENWYCNEISDRFRSGDVLMVGDLPGFYGLYQKRETYQVFDQFDGRAPRQNTNILST